MKDFFHSFNILTKRRILCETLFLIRLTRFGLYIYVWFYENIFFQPNQTSSYSVVIEIGLIHNLKKNFNDGI